MRAIDKFSRYGSATFNGQDYLKNHILEKFPIIKTDNTTDLEQVFTGNHNSEYVWLVDESIKTFDTFPWYFRPRQEDQVCIHAFPYVYKQSKKVIDYERVKLVPTKKGEYEVKQHSHICGQFDPYYGKEKFDIFLISEDTAQKQWAIENIENIQIVTTFEEAQQRAFTEMFWVIWNDTVVRDTFKFSYRPDDWSLDYVHVFGNGDIDQLDGIILCPKHYPMTQKELDHRFFANKKEIRIMASDPKQFDCFEINNFYDYQHALKYSLTDMFWGIPNSIEITNKEIFNYYISHHSLSDRKQNHVFLNNKNYDGLVLFSKFSPVSEKEIKCKFIVNRIETGISASMPRPFQRFTIDTYEDYLQAKEHYAFDMFWGIPSDVEILDTFMWEQEIQDLTLDRTTNYIFMNGEHRDGVVLFSKHCEVTKKEIQHRFLTNKKELDIIASKPKKYDQFVINNYEDYTKALYESKTQMFWGIPSDVEINKDFDFDLYFAHYNNYDRTINHVFLNGKSRDGIVLFSKDALASEKEVDHRFYIAKKEWNIVASKPKPYPVYSVNNYNEYLDAIKKSPTELFYIKPDDIEIVHDFDWNFYVDHHNQYERKINHVWKNGEYYDGLALTTKAITLTEKEIQHRFFAIKKEHDLVASRPKPFDIVFISNGEQNADENYKKLVERFPLAKRVDGVKGIHLAHKTAAEIVNTDMFWVVDADAQILDDFDFNYQISYYDIDGRSTVYVWRSFNPINGLIYGYGGVKLLPTQLTRDVDITSPDMTTSISKNFKSINQMSNITAFNTDAFSTWRSAFRECVKLASKTIARQNDEETEFRLNAWCTRGEDKPFGKYAIAGAILGREYGERNKENSQALKKINDFDWLQEQFIKQSYPQDE